LFPSHRYLTGFCLTLWCCSVIFCFFFCCCCCFL